MAVKRWVPLNQINGVAAGGTATINLPVGPRYHKILIGYKTATTGGATEAHMASEMTEVRVNMDGVTQRVASPQQIFNINRTKGKSPTVSSSTSIPGYMTLFFSEPQRKTTVQKEATAWGTQGVNTFQIEIDIAGSASSPVISGYALIDDVLEPPQGIVKWKRESIQVSATGNLTYKLDTGKGDSYQGLFFIEGTAGDIDDIELTWDGLKLYSDDENAFVEYINSGDFTKVSTYRHVPLDHNDISNAVPTVKKLSNGQLVKVGEMLATLTMGGANNVTLIREMVGSPD